MELAPTSNKIVRETVQEMMAWLKNYIIVLATLFGKRFPLLKTHTRLRVTLINTKRITRAYFSKHNITNQIWRLFVDSRIYFYED